MSLSLISTSLYIGISFVFSKYKTTLDNLYQRNKTYKDYIKLFEIFHNLHLCIFSFYIFYNLFFLLKKNNLLFDDFNCNHFKFNYDNADQILNICWLFCQLIIIQLSIL